MARLRTPGQEEKAMTLAEVMKALQAAGSEQTRKTYRRHGMPEPMFGVSYATLGKLQKRIRADHPLARALWRTGNADARMLATMVVDPGKASDEELDAWANALDWHGLCHAFVRNFAALTLNGRDRMEGWMRSRSEMTACAGWSLLGALASGDRSLPEAYFEPYLARIEREIHGAPNRVREAMNAALIAIGGRSGALAKKAIAAAKRVGPVEVDHGDTACRTPDAAASIAKVRARRAPARAGGRPRRRSAGAC